MKIETTTDIRALTCGGHWRMEMPGHAPSLNLLDWSIGAEFVRAGRFPALRVRPTPVGERYPHKYRARLESKRLDLTRPGMTIEGPVTELV